jgi:hypothetical protein
MATGSVSLEGVGRELPTSIDAGTIKVDKGGRYKVEVIMTVDDSTGSAYMEYEAYGAGVSIIPLLVVLVLAVTTHMVRNCNTLTSLFHFIMPHSGTNIKHRLVFKG